MTTVGQIERKTQNRIIQLLVNKLGYEYLGNFHERDNNNIIIDLLKKHLQKEGCSDELIRKATNTLTTIARKETLYEANKEIYSMLRYGVAEKENTTEKNKIVKFINWEEPEKNDYYVAEEVTIHGNNTKRPDIVLYINGIAVCVIELKRSTISVSEGIRQNLDNQSDLFIKKFFNTVQLVMAGNDTEGLRFGVIQTPEKQYVEWKEYDKATDDLSKKINKAIEDLEYKVDKNIVSICHKERLLDLIFNFIVFDGGVKKTCRHNQYFGVTEAKEKIRKNQGGIIWHTQGSGKSLTMVWLSRWIKENIPTARVLIITDREELDSQIQHKVFGGDGVGDVIYRADSGTDLINKINSTTPRLMCSLIHKFGKRRSENGTDEEADDKAYIEYIEQIKASLPPDFEPKGDLYVFVDECHRTNTGKLHQAMKIILPDALFIGFTGTPLLSSKEMTRRGIVSSIETFGPYIHTYKYPEAVADKVVLDLRYEARDIPQNLGSKDKIDAWFEAKTKGLNPISKARLKKRWGTLREIYSSESRLSKIVSDIVFDMETNARLNENRGNAILVASSIYEACRYYELFKKSGFDKCAIITSFTGDISVVKGEATGEARESENQFKYKIYQEMLGGKEIKDFENEVKEMFIKEPGRMKLLIVVDKLLTGFDAPSATYLYIDKSMRDHGLFQAICRVNRIDSPDKEYGYIVDYMDLFKSLEKAVKDYTDGAFDTFDKDDVLGLLKNRVEEADKSLKDLLEKLRALCELVRQPRNTIDFFHYFCAEKEDDLEEIEGNLPRRLDLYKYSSSLMRAFAEIVGNFEKLKYSKDEIEKIRNEVVFFEKVSSEMKLASGDFVDLKAYDADMRYLIDTYLTAEESKKISSFDDLSLVQLILDRGVEFDQDLPEDYQQGKNGAAEVIENNVRKKIIEKIVENPAYFEKMSVLLQQIIDERKNKKLEYIQYLSKIVELTRRIFDSKSEYPEMIRTSSAKIALYDNISQDIEEITFLDKAIIKSKPDNWLGDKGKENKLKRAIYNIVNDTEKVENIFRIVKEQREYW